MPDTGKREDGALVFATAYSEKGGKTKLDDIIGMGLARATATRASSPSQPPSSDVPGRALDYAYSAPNILPMLSRRAWGPQWR
jgi:hypothetical protein